MIENQMTSPATVAVAPGNRRIWQAMPFVAGLALICLLYAETFQAWWEEWTATGSFYQHSIFVPFFVMLMVWRNRARLAAVPWKPSWAGFGWLGLFVLLFLAGQRLDVTAVKSLSFLFLLLGGSLLLLGKAWTRVLLFPLLFVVMMMPLVPDQIINGIAFPIQLKSAQLATFLLNLLQLHAVCQGTLIQLDTYRMAVELPCSGFKTLVSLLTFIIAFAYLVDAAAWKRWALFLTTIPLALFINGLRISFIGIVGELISAPAAATFHDYSGFIVLTLAFLFLFNFARILRCERFLNIPLTEAEEERDREEAARRTAQGLPAETIWWRELRAWRLPANRLRMTVPFVLALDALLAVTTGAAVLVTRPLHPQPPIATFQVPRKFTYEGVTFRAQESPDLDKLDKVTGETLSPTRVINRSYEGSDGSHIHCFITSGSGRKTFHDPHACSLGANAVLEDVGTPDIPTPIGPVHVQESTYWHEDAPELKYRWMFFYVVEGKILQDKFQIRDAIMRQMILGDAGRPSYFVRILQQSPGADDEKREQLTRFVAGMWNEIGAILVGQKPGVKDDSPIIMPDTPQK